MDAPTTRRSVLTSLIRTTLRLMGFASLASIASSVIASVASIAEFVPMQKTQRRKGRNHAVDAIDAPAQLTPDAKRRPVDPHRLPRHVLPTRYELRLAPDLRSFTFTGTAVISVSIREQTSELLLNAVELSISSVDIAKQGGASHRGTVQMEEQLERCRLTFPVVLEPGDWRLHLTFAGTLNDKLRGFYRSSYKDAGGTTHVLAATQFEATDARRAFPCWDEPAFKAVFSSALVIDPALTAVSNTAIASERVEDGKKEVRFHDTIRMSTYLVAFVVGELEATEAVQIDRTPLRIWAVRGRRHLAAFGQEIGAFSLRFFQNYYGLPYPGDKLDLLAIPDFASGAMENLGAITFRETALLIDPKTATHAEQERVADVVAHENAHMWFGDLVTMSWWNGLWLNEAFATFMEMLAVDAWKPKWQRWTNFGVSRAAAFAVDGLHSTRPIEFPVHAPSDADAMFDVLTYEKGASVLRMLEQYLGPEVFRDGVREYLRVHAYDNADTRDLWTALGHAAKQSRPGESVPDMIEPWVFSPGYPLLTVGLDRGALTIRQERFTYLPASPADEVKSGALATGGASNIRWQVPIRIRMATKAGTRLQDLLLKESEARLDLPAGFEAVLVNESGHGFYRVRYAPDLLDRLLRLVPEQLAPIERFNLVNDAWATAVAGLMPMVDYLELTGRFKADHDRNVWAILIESLQTLNRIILPRDRPGLEALVRDRVQPLARELGWSPKPGEDELTGQLRADLIRALGTIGNDAEVQRRAAELFETAVARDHDRATDPIDPNLVPALIAILAHTGDEARYNEYLKRFRSATTPQEERRYLYALAGFQRPELVQQTLARTINGEFRTQDAPFIIRSLLMTVHGREQAWSFVKANWELMDRQFPKNGLRRMCEGIVGLATPELERDVRAFFTERRIDLGGKTLAQYLEQLRIAVVLREREAQAVSRYLSARKE
jgi:puromycin-sensitive aminopeptidase